MRINIASSHRFHLLDLARELATHGHEVRFYSYVPTKRALSFGLKKENSFSFYYVMLPLLGLVKLSKSAQWSEKLIHKALDIYMSFFMKPCDIYIALGVVYKKSILAAKKQFNAVTILEWGSKHILEQQRIMSSVAGFKLLDPYFIKRTVYTYQIVDYIAVASDHVKQSFVERGITEDKLLQNPYGVDLSMFMPTALSDDFDIIMVGGWSYRKGCDLLTGVCQKKGYKLLHVGGIVDLSFPDESNMTHIDAVDQKLLVDYYAKAKVFVLPSREEGLALVQPQALVCGLPIVCSKDTGGRDLRNFLEDKQWIIEMTEHTPEELVRCIELALSIAKTQIGIRSYSTGVKDNLTWQAYGNRYNSILLNLSKQ